MLANGHSFEGLKYQVSFYCSSKKRKRKRKKKSNFFEVISSYTLSLYYKLQSWLIKPRVESQSVEECNLDTFIFLYFLASNKKFYNAETNFWRQTYNLSLLVHPLKFCKITLIQMFQMTISPLRFYKYNKRGLFSLILTIIQMFQMTLLIFNVW